MLSKLYNKYGFISLFWISIICLIVIFIYNFFSGSTGTYVDHTRLIWNYLFKNTDKKTDNGTDSGTAGVENNTDNTKNGVGIENGNERTRHLRGVRPYTSTGELECRRVAERLTGLPFPKHRPTFLQNSVTNSNLELDCYCPQLRVAIEYNGRQHYEYTPYFHASRDAFYNVRYRDEMKARLCKENNVHLIIVPYTVPIGAIEEYIYKKFKEAGIIIK